MDPLSICASVVQLSLLAGNVTKLLTSITKSAVNAESQVSSLTSEVATLTSLLSCVKKTLGGCKSRPHAFDLVDDELWEQSDLALQDCEAGLSSLASFAVAIKANEKRRLWKVRVGIDMSIHARKLEQFRMSLRRSNCALQTVLHTITLSLTLQNNNSQTLVLTALDKLKSSIDDAMWMAARSPSRPQGNGAAFDSITSQNLQSLAKAAQTFYSTASSAAGSSVGSSNTEYMKMPKEAAGSVSGLNPIQAERLHDYIYNTSSDLDIIDAPTDPDDSFRQSNELNLSRRDSYHVSDPLPSLSDLDLQLPLMEVLEDFALEKMKERDFTSAASYLEQACSSKLGACPAPDIHLRLQTRLAICYLFQGNRPKCEAALKRMENFGGMLDLEALNILHAVAIGYLTECRFDEATDACQTALRAKLRLLGKSHSETLQTLGLLARIYDESDEVIHLEATRRLMPKGFIYVHPSNERDFLMARSSLIPRPDTETTTCGLVELDNNEVFPVYELPAGDTEHISPRSGLQRTLTRYEKVQADARQEAIQPEALSLKDTSEEEFFFKPTKAPKRSLSHSMLSMVRRSSSLRRSLSYKKRGSAGGHSDEAAKMTRSKTVLRRRQTSTKSLKEDAKADRLKRWKSIFGTWLIRRENATHPDPSEPTSDDHGPHELDPTPLGGIGLQVSCGVQTGYCLQEDKTAEDCLCSSDTTAEQKEFRSALGFCLANHSARPIGTMHLSNENFQETTMFQESLSRSSSGSKSSGSGAESIVFMQQPSFSNGVFLAKGSDYTTKPPFLQRYI
ncbi:hypothetical protein K4F52_004277 [Lecanicillium sp. MT-2017a]|nr:hypothetical protein K4F52_004277 [Lecanicillium sp. MT-2017a]